MGCMIVVFDSDCVLCAGLVRFILRVERTPTTRFVAARSAEGVALASAHGLTAADLDQTFLVVRGEAGLVRSDAALALAGDLRAPWCWVRALRVIPRPLRDWGYDRIARNRYRLFGRRPECALPAPGQQAHRFVFATAGSGPQDERAG